VSDLKRFSILLGLAAALSLVFVGSAFANFGPHGGYAQDTDSCAGCHRAHSSFSVINYTPRVGGELLAENEKPSALLVGSAATMTEFCNACHGATAPGASTNVVQGIFDSGPSAAGSVAIPTAWADGTVTAYQTSSTAMGALNGGGFRTSGYYASSADLRAVTSAHSMEQAGVLWGAGNAVSTLANLTCTSCHDPHGSSNYRLLKDTVNNTAVGGYNPDGTPAGMVFSTETGYSDVVATGGWLKHDAGAAQMVAYRPDYTAESSVIKAGTQGNSMSAWCAACHTQYNQNSSAYDYGTYEASSTALVGSQTRHRHPVDIAVKAGDANLQVIPMESAEATRIPLENAGGTDYRDDHIGCLTCHYAHGTSAVMGTNSWASAHLATSSSVATLWIPVRDGVPGVNPDKVGASGLPGDAVPVGSSALLRVNDRGVCERCHNK
jgi:predicted CXXCH cytochrome family protein